MATPPVVKDDDPAASAGTTPEKRSALVFVSGFGEAAVDQTAPGIARRVADALDRNAATGGARFAVEEQTRDVDLGNDISVSRATITRTAPDGSTAVLDVWRLPTEQAMRADYEGRSQLWKASRAALLVVRLRRSFAQVLRREAVGKSARQRAQLQLVRLGLVLLALYAVALVVGFAAGIADEGWVPGWATSALLAVTGLGIWKAAAIKRLTSGAITLTCLVSFVDHRYGAERLKGRLSRLLEHLHEQDDVTYERIDVAAYSFGSLVALDAFFPKDAVPSARYANVTTLITIGCPFDLVETYWPDYFEDRQQLPNAPKHWLNVYSPLDLFGSDFTTPKHEELGLTMSEDQGQLRRPENIRVGAPADAKLKLLDVVALQGLQAHGTYWSPKYEQEDTAFGIVLRTVYAEEALLA